MEMTGRGPLVRNPMGRPRYEDPAALRFALDEVLPSLGPETWQRAFDSRGEGTPNFGYRGSDERPQLRGGPPKRRRRLQTARRRIYDSSRLKVEPEEVAAGVMFVVKNKFVTGTTIDVDGGFLAGPRLDA